jgi:hypothetical protein
MVAASVTLLTARRSTRASTLEDAMVVQLRFASVPCRFV